MHRSTINLTNLLLAGILPSLGILLALKAQRPATA
jgi:hypothetical protein